MSTQAIRTILNQALAEITAALELPVNEARSEAQIVLQHCLKVNRAWLLSHENDILEADSQAVYRKLLNRRLKGEPVAYILGKREFYGLEFKVTPATLIPRPDTETLVEAVLQKIAQDKSCRVLDLGTGTGSIAISIATHRPLAEVTAVDQSASALAVARENAQNLNVQNVLFVVSDWFEALEEQRFDVIVSNPPYVAENDPHLNQGDLRFEPMTALAAGTDGLKDIRQIISQARLHLEPEGWLMLEHGYDQADKVVGLMASAGFTAISSVADLAGVLRVTLGQRLP